MQLFIHYPYYKTKPALQSKQKLFDKYRSQLGTQLLVAKLSFNENNAPFVIINSLITNYAVEGFKGSPK